MMPAKTKVLKNGNDISSKRKEKKKKVKSSKKLFYNNDSTKPPPGRHAGEEAEAKSKTTTPPPTTTNGEKNKKSSLEKKLKSLCKLLKDIRDESKLSTSEILQSTGVYKELKRILSLSTRTEDWTGTPSMLKVEHKGDAVFHETTYPKLVEEFETADAEMQRVLKDHPAAVRPLGRTAIADYANPDFFILDNSLRETTVGTSRGHTLEQKHKIFDAIAESGLKEIILGAFGSKISVDSQVASRWRSHLGRSFDRTWGFSSAYDFEPYPEDPLWTHTHKFTEKLKSNKRGVNIHEDSKYHVPKLVPKTVYSKEDLDLFTTAYQDFPRDGIFGNLTPKEILQKAESEVGRIPMGLLMMAG
jgi:hypothetical protein